MPSQRHSREHIAPLLPARTYSHSLPTLRPMRPSIPSLHRGTDSLELAFDSRALRTICESESAAKRHLGTKVAETLKHRLGDVRAATSIDEVIVGDPRLLDAASEQMVIDLCDGYQIVFSANHPKKPVSETGDLDWAKVSRVKILRIDNK
jgi:hypothetical protein